MVAPQSFITDPRDGTFDFYEPVSGPRLPLGFDQRLESWDAKTARSQILLSEYLDQVEALVQPHLTESTAATGLRLTVGLRADRSLTAGGGDLDNYLHPLARRLTRRSQPFASAFAEKRHGESTIGIGPVRVVPEPTEWDGCTVLTTASAETKQFKLQIAAAVPQQLVPAGPLELHVSYRLSSRRNWAALWKPTIDSLGGVLRVANPTRPFTPNDDRIVRLGLHRRIDESLGWNVAIRFRWHTIE